MGELEKELQKISRTLTELARKLDQVAAKAVGRPKTVAKAAKKPPKKAKGRKSGTEIVMALIKARKNGMDTATLRARTGFSGQKVRSIVWELSKKGTIKRVSKGLYKTAR
jgi:predicted transcriptional regulator